MTSSVARPRLFAVAAGLAAQFLSIAAGVFLGMQADEWRETRSHRELARATLESIRDEVRTNRAEIVARLPYHTRLHEALDRQVERPLGSLRQLRTNIGFEGLRSVTFAHTAYDLAMTSQALSYLPRQVALGISGAYLAQATFQRMEDGYLQQLFSPSAWRDDLASSFATAMDLYMGDVAYQEPALIQRYDRLLPAIDSALATR